MKIFKCRHCGNMIVYIENKGVPVVCCGEKMQELTVNTEDASTEKHVPVLSVSGNKVSVVVGSEEHPMTADHYIGWIAIETKEGRQRKELKNGVPKAEFMLCDGDEVEAVYAYCNLHGFWRN